MNKIERNVVTCYIYGSYHADKRAFVDAFVERKSAALSTAADESDESESIVRAIGAVIDKDTTKYLLVR